MLAEHVIILCNQVIDITGKPKSCSYIIFLLSGLMRNFQLTVLPPVVANWIIQAYDLVKGHGVEYLDSTHIIAENGWIIVDVPRVDFAQAIWNSHETLKNTSFGVKMFVGGHELISTPTKTNSTNASSMTILTNSLNSTLVVGDSPFIRSHINWLPHWAEQGTHWIYKDDRDSGYTCEAIIPFHGLPEVIGLSESDETLVTAGQMTRLEGVTNLIGSKVRDRKRNIGAAVTQAINLANDNGYAKVDYTDFWGETPTYAREWDLAAVAIKEDGYFVVITQNQDYQDKERWRKLVKRV